jgi:phospholipase C
MNKRTRVWLFSATCFLGACGTTNDEPITTSSNEDLIAGQTFGGSGDNNTQSPVKHVIVIIGENRTFDHVFATYQPKGAQRVDNLLSKGIINADGTPGPNFARSTQYTAIDSNPPASAAPLADPSPAGWQLSPGDKSVYSVLPPPAVGGPSSPFFTSLAVAGAVETGIETADLPLLLTGGTGITGSNVPDTRIPGFNELPPGPFQLTPGVAYDAYAASPVHRFYEAWQQLDCNVLYATQANPSGCLADLYPWVETTEGAGTNGLPQPAGFNDLSTGEGSTAMGFYNVQEGDAPFLKSIADTYAMSDNFHQAVQGGTGANHIMLGTGDAVYFSDGNGNAMVPPANEIENPNPQPGTNNWYTEDGYGTADAAGSPIGGGSYSDCSNSTLPGVGPVMTFLAGLPYAIDPKCVPGHYFLLNNYAPGYFGDGSVNTGAVNPFTVPPSTVPTIGDQLRSKDVSFAYFGEHYNRYLADPNYANPANVYCDICNFFQYNTAIMTNPTARQAHLKDTDDFYAGLAKGQLPAVSFVKPSGIVDGHPASSKLDLFEAFTKKIMDLVQSQPGLWQDTAIFVTFDEGGGYYDSGYVQPVDFFGDGSRIPLLVISPLATGGRISHEYADHVSVLKFIERNWHLSTVSKRSRDNLPNPIQTGANAYAPTNGPAIGDLFDLFNFSHGH